MSQDTSDVTVVGVCVVFCKNGKLTKEWIDLSKVSALAWTNAEVAERPANPPHGNSKIPKESKGEPSTCPAEAVPATGMCWWDGNQWICGD